MKTFVADKEIDIYFATSIHTGYGHKKIIVELSYNGEYKKFEAITNNMHGYDKATELDGDDKYHALYELIETQIIDEIAEWLENIE